MSKDNIITNNQKQNGVLEAPKRAVLYLRYPSGGLDRRASNLERYDLVRRRKACLIKARDLGAEVIAEYVDYDIPNRPADRPVCRELLERIGHDGDIDHVITDTIKRMTRDFASYDDVCSQLQAAGCQLITVGENVDETPDADLLANLMMSLAGFASTNHAADIRRGMARKAQTGGTTGRAPIGYLNVTEMVGGRPVKTVILDPKRGPLVHWAFEQFATGNWALDILAEDLVIKGLWDNLLGHRVRSVRPRQRLARLLSNRYYLGVVSFCGAEYLGRHTPLVTSEQVDQVQSLMRQHQASIKHHHQKVTSNT